MIVRIAYNEIRCDHAGCVAKEEVWEGKNLPNWTIREEGYPFIAGYGGGYATKHYCPAHTPMHDPYRDPRLNHA